MTPPAKRDELVTVLLERLDRFESALSGMRETLVRMEESEKRSRAEAADAADRLADHESRLKALEALSNKAEGAAWLGKALWVALAAVGGFVLRYVVGR